MEGLKRLNDGNDSNYNLNGCCTTWISATYIK